MHPLFTFTSPLFAAASAAGAGSNAVLFGNRGLALAAILAGVAVFIALIALIGRVLAATHPDGGGAAAGQEDAGAPFSAAPVASAIDSVPLAEMAAIAAAISVVLGPKVKIAEIRAPQPAPSVEAIMQMWALEGRRQIYTSHNVR
ncbi:MAG: hypothetical protein LBC18_13440 [Opitutaceae bacterium]|jgi:hypothetical protein|nr:hypothetical protein [Opitutaceae bacterium]